MKLIITIDTEEDNWGEFTSADNSLENIKKIPVLQHLFDEFDVKPTYLITYAVATDERSISILRNLLDRDRCEIATHCHPWNTPPFEEVKNERNSMLCNLPSDVQYRKLATLHNLIKTNFDLEPISFRAGRWGYNNDVAMNIYKLGYSVDTSISPYMDWSHFHGPDFSTIPPDPFRFSPENIIQSSPNGHMVEIPASVAFLQKNFALCAFLVALLRKRPMRYLGVMGILGKCNLVNKAWLSPELSDSNKMISLTKGMMLNNHHIINMMFHSTSLKAGLSPFVKTKDDEKRFFQNIKEFLIFARDNNILPVTLAEASKQI